MAQQPIIGFVGLSHLGIISATATAHQGYQVIGYDTNQVLIEQLQQSRPMIEEPQLADYMQAHEDKLIFTGDITQLQHCDIIYFSQDIATNQANKSNLKPLLALIENAIQHIDSSKPLVILSQVPPGFTRKLRCQHQLFYQVETLTIGAALASALKPNRLIIGSLAPEQPLPAHLQTYLTSFMCPILRMSFESAELCKIAISCFHVSQQATTNTLAEICETVNADWYEIIPALQLDKRIGPVAELKPSLGVSGGQLERDLTTVTELGQRLQTNTSVVSSWLQHSEYCKYWVIHRLQIHVLPYVENPRIAILGLAFKPNTHSIKNSPALTVIERLANYQLNLHDPIVNLQPPQHATVFHSITNAVRNTDIVIIMTAWDEYKKLDLTALCELMRGKTIVDPFRVLVKKAKEQIAINYFTLGKPIIKQAEYHYFANTE